MDTNFGSFDGSSFPLSPPLMETNFGSIPRLLDSALENGNRRFVNDRVDESNGPRHHKHAPTNKATADNDGGFDFDIEKEDTNNWEEGSGGDGGTEEDGSNSGGEDAGDGEDNGGGDDGGGGGGGGSGGKGDQGMKVQSGGAIQSRLHSNEVGGVNYVRVQNSDLLRELVPVSENYLVSELKDLDDQSGEATDKKPRKTKKRKNRRSAKHTQSTVYIAPCPYCRTPTSESSPFSRSSGSPNSTTGNRRGFEDFSEQRGALRGIVRLFHHPIERDSASFESSAAVAEPRSARSHPASLRCRRCCLSYSASSSVPEANESTHKLRSDLNTESSTSSRVVFVPFELWARAGLPLHSEESRAEVGVRSNGHANGTEEEFTDERLTIKQIEGKINEIGTKIREQQRRRGLDQTELEAFDSSGHASVLTFNAARRRLHRGTEHVASLHSISASDVRSISSPASSTSPVLHVPRKKTVRVDSEAAREEKDQLKIEIERGMEYNGLARPSAGSINVTVNNFLLPPKKSKKKTRKEYQQQLGILNYFKNYMTCEIQARASAKGETLHDDDIDWGDIASDNEVDFQSLQIDESISPARLAAIKKAIEDESESSEEGNCSEGSCDSEDMKRGHCGYCQHVFHRNSKLHELQCCKQFLHQKCFKKFLKYFVKLPSFWDQYKKEMPGIKCPYCRSLFHPSEEF